MTARLVAGVSAAVAAVAAHLAWLGWDQRYDRSPGGGELSGPYEAWQVVGLALTLAAVTAVVAYLGMLIIAVLVPTTTYTIAWSVDAAGGPAIGANLWPIGAVGVLVGTGLGLSLVGLVAWALGRRRRAHRHQATDLSPSR